MSRGKRSDKLPPALARRAYERREAPRGAWQHHHSERFKDMEDVFKAQLDVALLECVDGRHADPGKRGDRLLRMPFHLAATYPPVAEALPVQHPFRHPITPRPSSQTPLLRPAQKLPPHHPP